MSGVEKRRLWLFGSLFAALRLTIYLLGFVRIDSDPRVLATNQFTVILAYFLMLLNLPEGLVAMGLGLKYSPVTPSVMLAVGIVVGSFGWTYLLLCIMRAGAGGPPGPR